MSLPPQHVMFGVICYYYDYAEIGFGATETSYMVGTNARALVAGDWPATMASKSILLYATQDCYVRFLTPSAGGASSVQVRLYAGVWYTFPLAVSTIHVVRVSTDGTLRAVMMA